MEVVTYLKIIGRYWWLVLLTALVSTGVAAGIALTKAPTYSVKARVVAKPATSVLTDTRDLVNMVSEISMKAVIGTLAQVFTSAEVQQQAQAAAGLNATTAKDYPLEANILPDTTVIEVNARGHDPKQLTNYVNATIDASVARAPALFGVIELQPMERAVEPKDPTSPIPSRDIPIGGGLGLGLGILLALAIEYLRTPRRAEYEPQLRSLVPIDVPTLPQLTQVPSNQQALPSPREEMKVINGGQARPDYLVPGRQQRVGWQNGAAIRAERALQTDHKDDSFPG